MGSALSYPSQLRIDEHTDLRLATPLDVDRILDWTQDPAVYTWWEGRPLTRAEVEAKYTGKRTPAVIAYIIEYDDEPVGFIQAWQDDGCGLDMFLSASAQGRGLGTMVARGLANNLTARDWRDLSVDPAVKNEHAIRAWSRAGFVANGEFGEDNGHKTQIMIFTVDNKI